MPVDDPRAPTIDMTLEGDVLAPPSFWARMRAFWRVLPRGTLPALLVTCIVFLVAGIFLIGILIVAVPVLLALALLGLFIRASGPRFGPPARR